MCSLDSMNGPSVTTGTPSATFTVRVLLGSASASLPSSSPDAVSSAITASTSASSCSPASPENIFSRVSGLS